MCFEFSTGENIASLQWHWWLWRCGCAHVRMRACAQPPFPGDCWEIWDDLQIQYSPFRKKHDAFYWEDQDETINNFTTPGLQLKPFLIFHVRILDSLFDLQAAQFESCPGQIFFEIANPPFEDMRSVHGMDILIRDLGCRTFLWHKWDRPTVGYKTAPMFA